MPSTPVSPLETCHQRLNRPACFRRQIISYGLCVDRQQIDRHARVMIEVDHAHPAAFSAASTTPPELSDAATLRNQVACLRIRCNEVDELGPLLVVPDVGGMPNKETGFGYGDRSLVHRCNDVRHRAPRLRLLPIAARRGGAEPRALRGFTAATGHRTAILGIFACCACTVASDTTEAARRSKIFL